MRRSGCASARSSSAPPKGRGFTAKLSLSSARRALAKARFGLTVTRKVGTATERNRIRRRLRAALAQAFQCASPATRDLSPKPGHDYVLVARREALYLPFDALTGDVKAAVAAIGDRASRKRGK